MNTLTIINNTRPAGAGITSSKKVNTVTRTATPAKAVYEVDSAVIIGSAVEVEYFLNDAGLSISIALQTLKSYVAAEGMNEYCFDSSDYAGCHVQDAGTADIDTYLDENLEGAVAAYLQSIRAGQHNVN
ncbi:hypothetical protein [Mucilaginibacter pedocola]|uniref:Uncharacterized protein n=1 Tax=Mucilaginibacter pedocola TaxID=1792845 RepID=A0A1S9P8E9_9SPHI|nr:hypothetical protein [Mucilaginibacter pedocola]OOQ57117.1 hypothetical protein BC343_16485 [Mucilaginibacter pedocola]